MKTLSIDFEYRSSEKEFLDLVSVSFKWGKEIKSFWLFEDIEAQKSAKEFIDTKLAEGYILLCHMATAEGRALLSLGYTQTELLNIPVLDTYVLWIPLREIDEIGFGIWFDGDGNKNISTPPKFGEMEDGEMFENDNGELVAYKKPSHKRSGKSLVDLIANRLGINIDSKHKEKMRDLILYNKDFNEEEKVEIMKYCESDIVYLLDLAINLVNLHTEYMKNISSDFIIKTFIYHSKWMFVNAIVSNNGLPLNVERFEALSSNYNQIKNELITEMNELYPLYVKEKGDWKQKYESFENLIHSLNITNYPVSEKTGKYKTDKETLKQYVGIPQLAKFRETKKALQNIGHLKNKQRIFENLGVDGRLRLFTNPYGSITGRNQPSIRQGWIFGMSRWLRALLDTESERVIVGADYSSQEISILAEISGDEVLKNAYISGDPYTYFAQKCGYIPENVVRKGGKFYSNGELLENQNEFKNMRDMFKTLMLGIGYGEGIVAIGNALTSVKISQLPKEQKDIISKSFFDDEYKLEARKIIEGNKFVRGCMNKDYDPENYYKLYFNTFKDIQNYRKCRVSEYERNKYLFSKDFYPVYQFKKANAIPNFPIQSCGSAILKVATALCIEKGLRVCATLHDAIYIDSHKDDAEKEKEILCECMRQAVIKILGDDLIRVDAKIYKTDWEQGISDFCEGDNDMLKKYVKYTKNNLF